MTAMIIIITIIIPTLSATVCVRVCLCVSSCGFENTVRTLAKGFYEPCSFAWSLDMTSRHHPFVFHKQYVLTLHQAGATSPHVRPADNTTKNKRPFVFGGVSEEGKQESEKLNSHLIVPQKGVM